MRLEALAHALALPWEGEADLEIRNLAGLDDAGATDLSFVASTHHVRAFEASRAGAFILPPGFERKGRSCLRSEAPYVDFARAVELFYPLAEPPRPGVHPSAVIAEDVDLGAEVSIGPYVVIGARSRIGAGSVLHAHVTLYPGVEIGRECVIHSGAHLREGVRIGDRVVVQNGAVIGSEGFGFAFRPDGSRLRVPHRSGVELADEVEIGANSTLDAAHPAHRRYGHAESKTRVGQGTKIDNLVHVAHGVEIGERSTICATSGLAGGVRIGNNVFIGGQTAMSNAQVGDGSFVGPGSGVVSDLPAGSQVLGRPVVERRLFARIVSAQKRLPELLRRVRRLELRLGVEPGSPDEED